MELFRYNNTTSWLNGVAVNNWDTITWTERYLDPGEFTITAPVSSGLQKELPLGSIISHTRTYDFMLVENHEIVEKDDADSEIKITGRSYQIVLDNRVVGQNQDWSDPPDTLVNYVLAADKTWNQAAELINDHIVFGLDPNDRFFTYAEADVTGLVGVEEERIIKRGSLHTRVMELLDIEGIGIRAVRANKFELPYPPGEQIFPIFLIHDGVDRRKKVVFSVQNGDFDSASFLWSLKNMKNSAYINGRYVEAIVHGPEAGLDRRVLYVDGSDIDGNLSEPPTGGALTAIRNLMITRANQALKKQRLIELARTDISADNQFRYRVDYDIGDVVSVNHDYGPNNWGRIVEHTEIVDQYGESAHPTLEILGTF